jgi:hypothetical protein
MLSIRLLVSSCFLSPPLSSISLALVLLIPRPADSRFVPDVTLTWVYTTSWASSRPVNVRRNKCGTSSSSTWGGSFFPFSFPCKWAWANCRKMLDLLATSYGTQMSHEPSTPTISTYVLIYLLVTFIFFYIYCATAAEIFTTVLDPRKKKVGEPWLSDDGQPFSSAPPKNVISFATNLGLPKVSGLCAWANCSRDVSLLVISFCT